MHKYFFLFLFFSFIFYSCDDGNIITTTFDFDDETDLSLCSEDDLNVLYFIDSETNEAISFEFSLDDFDGTFLGDNNVELEEIEIEIDATNKVTYRRLNSGTSGSDYYCQQIPPSSPQVIEEFISTTGGTATLQIRIQEQDDDDGVPAELEDINNNGNLFDDDSDGDGIPDFLDTDDDNDNVLTRIEADFEVDENDNPIPGEYVNTDEDFENENDLPNLPNYLDNDDDADGVLTINEDLNVCIDPENPLLNPNDDTNADGLPNYLNPDATDSEIVNVVKSNKVTRVFLTLVVFNDITFEKENSEESLSFTSFIMGRYENSVEQSLPFNDTVTSIEDVENICQ